MGYAAERRAARAVLEGGSSLVPTARGTIECAVAGEGGAVLVLHGAAGGYDQGLLIADLVAARVRSIVPSRPGYLRTPLAVGATPAEQADAYAALLDALGVRDVAVLAASAGGMSGLAFAARHPDRCAALILVSAVSRRVPRTLRSRFALAALRDRPLWLFGALPTPLVLGLAGLPRADRARLDRDGAELVRRLLLPWPAEARRAGVANDARQGDAFAEDLSAVRAPTLVIHGTRDSIVPFAHGEHAARAIGGARLLAVEGGHHVCLVTHRAVVAPAIGAFLRERVRRDG